MEFSRREQVAEAFRKIQYNGGDRNEKCPKLKALVRRAFIEQSTCSVRETCQAIISRLSSTFDRSPPVVEISPRQLAFEREYFRQCQIRLDTTSDEVLNRMRQAHMEQ